MVENSYQVSVSFLPWEEKGFKLELLHIWEQLGGKQPGGTIEASHDGNQEALDFITSQQTGKIKIVDGKDGGQSYSFGIFIVDREFFNNRVHLKFTIIPENNLQAGKAFYTRPKSETYPSLQGAIESVWPGEIIKNVETDTPSDKEVYQDNETGCDFLRRLCSGWKYKSVFAFSWDGLVLKDIGDDIKPKIDVTGNSGLWYQRNMASFKYDSSNNNLLFNPWTDDNKDDDKSISKSVTGSKDFKDLQPKYVTSSISRDTYKIHAPGYDVAERNLKKNSEFRGYSNISLVAQDMPKEWKIGDVINYRRIDPSNSDNTEKDIKFSRYVIAGSEFFFSQNGATQTGPNGNDFEWTATLWGLDELDINKELQNNTQNNNE